MRSTARLAALTSLLLVHANGVAQPSVPVEVQGDLSRVRSCAALVATYAPVTHYADAPCTEMACANGFSVDVGAQGRRAGRYRFEVQADGEWFSCEPRLPLTSCNDGALCTWAGHGGAAHLSVTRSGCALPAAQQALTSVEFDGVCPAHVRVRMLRDGVEVGRYESDVAYRRVVVNGEHCGPVCAQGRFASRPALHR